MAVAMDWGESAKAAKEGARGGKSARRFQINDGETVNIRFLMNEDFNKPLIFKRHYVRATRRYVVCAEDAAREGEHDGCVLCYLARQQGKDGGIRSAARVFGFTVLDPRKYHIDENAPKGKKFSICKEDPTCKGCRRQLEAKTLGVCHWTVPGQVLDQIRDFEAKVLSSRCAKCAVGKITVTAYVCPDCEEPMDVDDPTVDYKCHECSSKTKEHRVIPKALVKCSKGCKGARPATLADAWVTLTRSGEGTETNYNFAPGDIEPIPEEFDNPQPLDLAKDPEFMPVSADEQAAIAGVQNPFRKKKGRDEDDDDDDNDRKKKKRHSDDDDDDEVTY